MAKLIQVTEEAVNGITHISPITKLVGVAKINNVYDEGGKGIIQQQHGRTEPRNRKTTELKAAIDTAMQVASGDPNTPVTSISLTVKRTSGDIVGREQAGVRSVNVDNIVDVQAAPAPADSLVLVQDPHKSTETEYLVDEDLATILAAANA